MATEKQDSKLEKCWKAFEKSGSISDFMKYHAVKQGEKVKVTAVTRSKKKTV